MFRGTKLRSMIPDITSPSPYMVEMHQKLVENQRHTKQDYDVTARDLPKLSVGDKVRIQDHVSKRFTIRGVIRKVLGEREYLIKQDEGGELKRNRRFLILDKGFRDVTADLPTDGSSPKTVPSKKSVKFKSPIEETQDERRKSSRKTRKPQKYTK